MQKEYKTKDITIIWKPELCQHVGECVRRLPKVYDPKARPWYCQGATGRSRLLRP